MNRPRDEDAYPELISRLTRDDGVKILFSEWLIRSTADAEAVGNRYMPYIDANDRLFVCEIHDVAWHNVMNERTAAPLLNAA